MKPLVSTFRERLSGATATEYGLIAGLVSVVIITVLGLTGDQLELVFEKIKAAPHHSNYSVMNLSSEAVTPKGVPRRRNELNRFNN